MATCLQNKISLDMAADNASFDSLSFSGFLRIQDHQLKFSPTNTNYDQIRKQTYPEFEFSSITCESKLINPQKNSQPKQDDQMINQLQSKGSSLPPIAKSGIISSRSRDKKNENELFSSVNNDQNKKQIRETKKSTSDASRSWFQSFVSPCKECQTVEPKAIINTNNSARTRSK